MPVTIKVENLSKSYIIKHTGKGYVSLRETITDNIKRSFYRTKNIITTKQIEKSPRKEEFWALNGLYDLACVQEFQLQWAHATRIWVRLVQEYVAALW